MLDHTKFNQIKAFIFDVDGVFTNADVLVLEDGSLLRTMNVRDGLAVKLAKDAGYLLAVITKGTSEGAHMRLKSLGIDHYYHKLNNKVEALEDLLTKFPMEKDSMLYMGDDLPDLDIFPYVGITACPKDAANEVLQIADYISPKNGGQGCVRDIIERVMRIQGKWPRL